MSLMSRDSRKTTKSAVVRPFELNAQNVWRSVQYRADATESWKNVLLAPFVVLPSTAQDLRADVLHELKIEVDIDHIERAGASSCDVRLLVVARDNFAKKILLITDQLLSDAFDVQVTASREVLQETSLSRRIDFEVMLVADRSFDLNGVRVRRGGRLAKHTVGVSAESHGFTFNFVRTSASEFEAMGLPGTTCFHVAANEQSELLLACDDVTSALRVLVNEEAWLTLQEIRAGDKVGEAMGLMMGSELVLSLLTQAAGAPGFSIEKIEEGSVVARVVSWLSGTSGRAIDELKEVLADEGGAAHVQPLVQDALKLTRALRRIHLGGGNDE